MRSLLLLLLLSSPLYAQPILVGKPGAKEVLLAQEKLKDAPPAPRGISVGNQYKISEIEHARGVMESIKQKYVILKEDEYELILPDKDRVGTSPLLYVPLTSNGYHLYKIPAGKEVNLLGKLRGDTEEKFHTFPAQKSPWSIIRGKKIVDKAYDPELLVVVRNASKPEDPPEEADRVIIQVTGTVPTPGPGPKPPDPDVKPPLPAAGLRVLIVHDPRLPLPAAQDSAIHAGVVVDWMNRKCAKVDNKPEWRVFSPTTNLDNASQIWKDAMALKRDSLPWLIVSDGTKGYQGPLPADTDALLAKLKEIGGE